MKAETPDFPFSSKEELDNYFPYLMNRLATRWAFNQNRALAGAEVQGAKMRILSCLAACKELTINQLSVLSVTEQSTTSRTVDQLVEEGLVKRHINKSDQRIRTVRLTPKGFKKLVTISPIITELYRDLVSGIDEQSVRTCVRVLQTMLENVREHEI